MTGSSGCGLRVCSATHRADSLTHPICTADVFSLLMGTQGDDAYEMRLKLVSSSTESYPFKDE